MNVLYTINICKHISSHFVNIHILWIKIYFLNKCFVNPVWNVEKTVIIQKDYGNVDTLGTVI